MSFLTCSRNVFEHPLKVINMRRTMDKGPIHFIIIFYDGGFRSSWTGGSAPLLCRERW